MANPAAPERPGMIRDSRHSGPGAPFCLLVHVERPALGRLAAPDIFGFDPCGGCGVAIIWPERVFLYPLCRSVHIILCAMGGGFFLAGRSRILILDTVSAELRRGGKAGGRFPW